MEASALSHPVGLGRVSLAGPLLRLRSDEQLVALFRAGHDEAFGTIHDRYRARLFAYARQMLGGSRSDAEDVLQDVFLRAYNSLRGDRREVALRAWLYRVAHNRCIDQLRRPAPAPEDVYDVNRGASKDLLDEAERREDLRRLIADVRALPEQQRSALLMREMEGLSYNELADALGVTVPAIKSLLVRARVGLVEAVEARDTACVEIRHDIASAFDRGVRASGRSRKHLRECAGCREYRGALRGVEKRLNGLAFPSGPLTTVMKVLGIGGAGSGAAAGGSAVVAGGGGAAATVGGGAMAATATKVVAVVAAAAVVGGGAATVEKKVDQRTHRAATPAAVVHHAPATTAVAAAGPDTQLRVDRGVAQHTATTAAVADHAATRAPRVTKLLDDPSGPLASPGTDAPKVEPTTGGIVAPDETAPDATPTDATASDPGGSGTATAGTGTSNGAASTVAQDDAATTDGTTTPSSNATSTSTSGSTSGTTTSDTSSPGGTPTPGTVAPYGTVSQTPSAPMAQGASAQPSQQPAG
ncbi:MAG TPA: sigma-70 family RNA polymerase sigma factor [Baekduia sp.]